MTFCAPSQHELNKPGDADGALEQLSVCDVRAQFVAQEFSQFVEGGLSDFHMLSVKRYAERAKADSLAASGMASSLLALVAPAVS